MSAAPTDPAVCAPVIGPAPDGRVLIVLTPDELKLFRDSAKELQHLARALADGQNSDQIVKARVVSKIVTTCLNAGNEIERVCGKAAG